MVDTVPRLLITWLWPFVGCFSAANWQHVQVLVAGAVLCPGRRTVTAALRVMGLEQITGFAVDHRVLSTARWSARLAARVLLRLLVSALVPHGPVIIAVDDTIERRWGKRIAMRGIYRDPVRSSHGHFVKVSGLRWLCVMLLAPIPWAGAVWALPFLSVLAPSERHARERGRRYKTLIDQARQALLQTARWLPGRAVIAVADSSFAAIELLRAVAAHLTVITRLRLDARLYEPPPPRRPGRRGRVPTKGARLPTLSERLADPATAWQRVTLRGWYGKRERRLDLASGTAIWHHPGRQVAIRWVLVRDAEGEKPPQAFLSTDPTADPVAILGCFVQRWRVEVTLSEVRRHLGVETQRQWSDRAILRTTPALLGLFSLVTLWANRIAADRGFRPAGARWYRKADPTFSDALALVRRELWTAPTFATSRPIQDNAEIPTKLLDRLILVACRPP